MGSRIPLFGLGIAAKSPFVTAKSMQNLYAETRPVSAEGGEKSVMVAYGTPGENLFLDVGATPFRGGLEFEPNSVAYAVHRGVLKEINNAGVATNVGNLLTTTGRVSMAHNGTQVMIVDGTYGYIYNTSMLVFAQIVDPDFPANPTTVTFLAGRFVVSFANSSRFYESDAYNGISWDPLRFANAETSPDPIISMWSSNGQLLPLGALTTEFWGLSGTLDFTFTPLQGTANEWGLAARWSIAKYDNTFACLIKNRMGQFMVAKMGGTLPQKISNPDIDSIISTYTTTSDATAYSYMLGGHPMYVISFPTAGKSWLYDGSTGFWSPLKSFGSARHNGEFSFTLLGRTLVADSTDGKLYDLKASALTDNGASIERELVSETITNQDGSYLEIDCLRVDMEVGVGLATGQGSNPQIGLAVSRDNGKTWGAQMWRDMGKIGEYKARPEWRRLGTTRAATFKLTVTDPVPVVFVSATVNPEN